LNRRKRSSPHRQLSEKVNFVVNQAIEFGGFCEDFFHSNHEIAAFPKAISLGFNDLKQAVKIRIEFQPHQPPQIENESCYLKNSGFFLFLSDVLANTGDIGN